MAAIFQFYFGSILLWGKKNVQLGLVGTGNKPAYCRLCPNYSNLWYSGDSSTHGELVCRKLPLYTSCNKYYSAFRFWSLVKCKSYIYSLDANALLYSLLLCAVWCWAGTVGLFRKQLPKMDAEEQLDWSIEVSGCKIKNMCLKKIMLHERL